MDSTLFLPVIERLDQANTLAGRFNHPCVCYLVPRLGNIECHRVPTFRKTEALSHDIYGVQILLYGEVIVTQSLALCYQTILPDDQDYQDDPTMSLYVSLPDCDSPEYESVKPLFKHKSCKTRKGKD